MIMTLSVIIHALSLGSSKRLARGIQKIDAVRRPRCADSQGESKTGANSPSKYILDADNRQEAHASGINADNMFAV